MSLFSIGFFPLALEARFPIAPPLALLPRSLETANLRDFGCEVLLFEFDAPFGPDPFALVYFEYICIK